MAETKTPVCQFNQAAIDFQLAGTDGRTYTLSDCRGENGTLIMFICNHCPFVQAIQRKLIRDVNELHEYGVKAVAIMSNDYTEYPEDSFENMKIVAEKFNYPFPYLLDGSQEIAKAYAAVCTPDFFGYNHALKLQYRGRLDESRMNNQVDGRRDLFEAMKQIAQTGKGPEEQKVSVGCSIKWRSRS